MASLLKGSAAGGNGARRSSRSGRPAFTRLVIAPALPRFIYQHPGLRIEIDESDAIQHAIDRSRAELAYRVELRALQDGYASLSPGEREVMVVVVRGRLNKQVGGELGISEITVKAHRGNVMRKRKPDPLADLVDMAAKLRLVDAPRN
jgi:DNA-binding CsgD family transcriptional regulator